MGKGFSFASVVLSYFLVGGGMFTATLVGSQLQLGSELAGYALLAAGAFVGGFVAARASRGQTILEPAIGAVAVVASIVGLAAATPIGKLIWVVAQDQTMKFVGAVGLAGIVGALLGAWLSERLLGDATRSSIPWLIYTAMAAFGACLLATLLASIIVLGTHGAAATADQLGQVMLIGIAGGCLIAGLAVGASARVRPLIAALLGGGLGVTGFFALVARTSQDDRSDVVAGIAVLASGGAVVTLIGALIGWLAVGRRSEPPAALGPGAPRGAL
jgi:hypothetical protein